MNPLRSTIGCLVLLLGTLSSGLQTPTPVVAEEPSVAVISHREAADPFARLRRPVVRAQAEYWEAVGRELANLQTLDGAAYNARFGVLTLHGKPAEPGQGPFHLDDLIVALRTALFRQDDLGMTIDPDPEDPHGPEMVVQYFGGCEDSAFGWVLFECDRLLKSLSNGEDNLTRLPLKPAIDEFANMLELGLMMTGKQRSPEWNRFWISTDLEDGPSWYMNPRQSNGYQPVVLETDDQTAIHLHHCRLYLRTEVMAWRAGQLVTARGQASPVADRFAKHFNVYFDEFAELYPVFGRAAALARLTVLAEWITKTGIPMDLQYVRDYQPEIRVLTPRATPASNTSLSAASQVAGGIVQHEVRSFGGVDFRPRAFYPGDDDGKAKQHQTLSDKGLAAHPRDLAWQDAVDGGPVGIVVIPTLKTQLKPLTDPRVTYTAFRRTPPAEPPPGRLPGTARPVAGADRSTRVSREEALSLDEIDRLRAQQRSVPPREPPVFLEVQDARYIRMADRKQDVPREPIPLAEAPRKKGHPTRGPPTIGEGSEQPEPIEPPAEPSFGSVPERKYEHAVDRESSVGRETPVLEPSGSRDTHQPRGPPPDGSYRRIPDRLELVGRENVALTPTEENASWGFPVFQTSTISATYNLPRLMSQQNLRLQREMGVQGRTGTTVQVPDHLALVSELGDIMVGFGTPEIDQQRGAIYFPASPPGQFDLLGYYPQSRTLEFRDGMKVTFDQQGFPALVRTDEGTVFQFEYDATNQDDFWPRPQFCRVQPASERAEAGMYRLTDDRTPVAEESDATRPKAEAVESADPSPSGRPAVSPPSRPSSDTTSPDSSAGGPDSARAAPTAPSSSPQASSPPGREIASLTASLPPETRRDTRASEDSSASAIQLPEMPLQVHPAPDQLNYSRIRLHVPPGETRSVGTPLQFYSEQYDLSWVARLRARETSPSVYERPDWNGDPLWVQGADGGPLLVVLMPNEGLLPPGEIGRIQVAVLNPVDGMVPAAVPEVTDFFVDVQLSWRKQGNVRQERISLPFRLDSRPSRPAGFMVIGVLFLTIVLTVSALLLRR